MCHSEANSAGMSHNRIIDNKETADMPNVLTENDGIKEAVQQSMNVVVPKIMEIIHKFIYVYKNDNFNEITEDPNMYHDSKKETNKAKSTKKNYDNSKKQTKENAKVCQEPTEDTGISHDIQQLAETIHCSQENDDISLVIQKNADVSDDTENNDDISHDTKKKCCIVP